MVRSIVSGATHPSVMALLVFNPTLSYVHLESKIHNSVEGFGNVGLFEEKGVVNVFETTRRNASLEALFPLSVRFNFIS